MHSEKTDILADKRKQTGQIMKMLSLYCRNHRLVDLELGRVPPKTLEAIGTEIVDLFIDRVQAHQKKTPPKPGAHENADIGDRPGRSRG